MIDHTAPHHTPGRYVAGVQANKIERLAMMQKNST
jgi:hypothetical protein